MGSPAPDMVAGMSRLRRRLILTNLAGLVLVGPLLVANFDERVWPVLNWYPALDSAEQRIRENLQYVERVTDETPREYLVTLAVTSYVVGHVSAARYGFLNTIVGRPPTGTNRAEVAERALASGSGICGHAAAAAMELFARLGVTARQLYTFDSDGGHVTVETWYDGAWHWFDPTFGYFYRQPDVPKPAVLSLVDVLQLPDPNAVRVASDSRLWAQVTMAEGAEIGNGLDISGAADLLVTLEDGTSILRRGSYAIVWPDNRE